MYIFCYIFFIVLCVRFNNNNYYNYNNQHTSTRRCPATARTSDSTQYLSTVRSTGVFIVLYCIV